MYSLSLPYILLDTLQTATALMHRVKNGFRCCDFLNDVLYEKKRGLTLCMSVRSLHSTDAILNLTWRGRCNISWLISSRQTRRDASLISMFRGSHASSATLRNFLALYVRAHARVYEYLNVLHKFVHMFTHVLCTNPVGGFFK